MARRITLSFVLFVLALCLHFSGATSLASDGGLSSPPRYGTDPRCPADFAQASGGAHPQAAMCPSYTDAHGYPPTHEPLDPSTCRGTDCGVCFSEPEWKSRLRALGLGKAKRTLPITILSHQWLSHEVTATIAHLFLSEILGFTKTRTVSTRNVGNIDMICCDTETDNLIDFERWLSTNGEILNEDGFFTAANLPIGYTGTSGLFVPYYTAEAFPLATSYNAYKYLPDYANMFPRAFSTNCSDKLLEKTPENIALCAQGANSPTLRFVCDVNAWSHTSCVNGSYVPPQCEGDNARYCQELYMTDPLYDAGYFEAMIKNNGLNFTLPYLGADTYPDFILSKLRREENFIFYWYSPDPLTAASGARLVNFEPPTAACEKLRNPDPTLSKAKCGYPATSLQKVARRDVLSRDPDLKFFFDSFVIDDATINSLLAEHHSVGGNSSVHDLACGWLKRSFVVWSPWVQHTARDTSLPTAVSDGTRGSLLAALIAVPIAITVVGLAAGAIIVLCVRYYNSRTAPRTAPLYIIRTDVVSSTPLMEKLGSQMKVAMAKHNAIVRELIETYGAYEVKNDGDGFMIAISESAGAGVMRLVSDLLLHLQNEEFPREITEYYRRNQKYAVLPILSSSQDVYTPTAVGPDVAQGVAGFPTTNHLPIFTGGVGGHDQQHRSTLLLTAASTLSQTPPQGHTHVEAASDRHAALEIGTGSHALFVNSPVLLTNTIAASTKHQLPHQHVFAGNSPQTRSHYSHAQQQQHFLVTQSSSSSVPTCTTSAPAKVAGSEDAFVGTNLAAMRGANASWPSASKVGSGGGCDVRQHWVVSSTTSAGNTNHNQDNNNNNKAFSTASSDSGADEDRESCAASLASPAPNPLERRRHSCEPRLATEKNASNSQNNIVDPHHHPHQHRQCANHDTFVQTVDRDLTVDGSEMEDIAPRRDFQLNITDAEEEEEAEKDDVTFSAADAEMAGDTDATTHEGATTDEEVVISQSTTINEGEVRRQKKKIEEGGGRIGSSRRVVATTVASNTANTAASATNHTPHNNNNVEVAQDQGQQQQLPHYSSSETVFEHRFSSFKRASYLAGQVKSSMAMTMAKARGRGTAPLATALPSVCPPAAYTTYDNDVPHDPMVWKGLLVRIAIHYCTEVTPEYNAITGRYDYLGHDVNVCARVEKYAQGGQVLMTESTFTALQALEKKCGTKIFRTEDYEKGELNEHDPAASSLSQSRDPPMTAAGGSYRSPTSSDVPMTFSPRKLNYPATPTTAASAQTTVVSVPSFLARKRNNKNKKMRQCGFVAVCRAADAVVLKGVDRRVALYSAVPHELSKRIFMPLNASSVVIATPPDTIVNNKSVEFGGHVSFPTTPMLPKRVPTGGEAFVAAQPNGAVASGVDAPEPCFPEGQGTHQKPQALSGSEGNGENNKNKRATTQCRTKRSAPQLNNEQERAAKLAPTKSPTPTTSPLLFLRGASTQDLTTGCGGAGRSLRDEAATEITNTRDLRVQSSSTRNTTFSSVSASAASAPHDGAPTSFAESQLGNSGGCGLGVVVMAQQHRVTNHDLATAKSPHLAQTSSNVQHNNNNASHPLEEELIRYVLRFVIDNMAGSSNTNSLPSAVSTSEHEKEELFRVQRRLLAAVHEKRQADLLKSEGTAKLLQEDYKHNTCSNVDEATDDPGRVQGERGEVGQNQGVFSAPESEIDEIVAYFTNTFVKSDLKSTDNS